LGHFFLFSSYGYLPSKHYHYAVLGLVQSLKYQMIAHVHAKVALTEGGNNTYCLYTTHQLMPRDFVQDF